MARTGKESKAKQKKAERKAMEKKMNAGFANVKLANEQEDPLSALPSLTSYNKNGLDLKLETLRGPEIDEKTMEWAFKLMETNMKALYESCYQGKDPDLCWNESRKRDELTDPRAWFLIAKSAEGTPAAFAHFRYDMDYDDEVVYCYEIQVEPGFRRKGLGKFMLKVLELLMIKADMLKIMATIFKNDEPEVSFFKNCLKFETDETSPLDDVYETFQYEIVSRFNLKKKREMEAKENSENKPIN
ncbi:N-alpha-acetyltransferase 40 [Eurytemora carolleeae]|uniref:N-alpha-acetyltransferase 40 n=1 Tax=Eurytemora carolleeae TaxID=1294199 RepID=UPI000C75963C|nr:N-alpha-acetyltransferase 40 [Eurytemora carolleeae]|eukprot:XP_023327688.1 N-alpha-acetyltransferase 40-like [Eurytemora affinis]